MNFRKTAKNLTRILPAALAGTAIFSACQVPPTPPAREDGAALPLSYAVFEWKNENDFRRIPEFFTDEEFTGFSRVVRSDPKKREGIYLILGLDFADEIPAGSKATLRYFRPDKTGEQTQIFELPDFAGTPAGELRLGLTGDAWPKNLRRKRPSAWKLTVHAPDGTLLVSRRSFLWELPDEKTK